MKSKTNEKKKKPVKRKLVELEKSSEDEVMSLHDSESSLEWAELDEESDEEEPITEGCHVVVKIHGEKNDTAQNYVCEIQKVKKMGYDVKFLKKIGLTSRFIITNEIAYVPEKDVARLPKAHVNSRSRFKDMLYFEVDLATYSIFA